MSRAVASALTALLLASNLVGGICFWCHNDGETHDEPCCGQSADADQPPQLGDVGCCEQLSQWRVTQAVERVEHGAPQQIVAVVSLIVVPADVTSRSFVATREPPRPGGGLLQQHRALLI
jgi:hypothetical protein